MSTTNRLPRAPSTPLPELIDFLQPFQGQFRRRENRTALLQVYGEWQQRQ